MVTTPLQIIQFYCDNPVITLKGSCQGYHIQCSSDISEPKYMRNARQPNTRIRVWIYAYTRIRIRAYAYVLIRVCLISMYELTC